MTQMKLPEGKARRPRGRSGKYNFGARANRHTVGQSSLPKTPWRRDVHSFLLTVDTPSTGERATEQLIGSPGTGFTREIRRIALHGAIALNVNLAGENPITNIAGVLEMVMGLAESTQSFTAILTDSEAAGMYRRYVSFAQGAGAFKFWLPSGFNQMGQGEPVQGGSPWQVYIGVRVAAITAGASNITQLAVVGVINTQEKEERVYS